VSTVWVDRACPLCGSSDHSRIMAESNIDLEKLDRFAFASRKSPEYMHPRLINCNGCGLLYGSPVLAPEVLARAYQAADYDSNTEAHHASSTYSDQIRKTLHSLPDLNGTLDIGTGNGAFLEQLITLGFQNVAGVEPSEAPYAAAPPGIREKIRLGIFRAEDFTRGQFVLVTCFQTMEHVPDPLGIARGVLSLLKPGGCFAIVIHNREALSAKILGFKSPIFDIEHLQLFSPRTARRLLEEAGFRRVKVTAIWNRYPLHYWLKLLPLPSGTKSHLLQWANRSSLGRMMIPLPAGNLFAVGYRDS
jgi:SAM-dependent methyltransferase